MRLLAIAETFFPEHPTGLARVAWDVCRAMARQGHDVHLLCPTFRASSELQTQRIADVQVSRFAQPRVSAFDPRNPSIRIERYRAAIAAIGDPQGWDVIHGHGIYGVLAAAEATGRRIPIVQTIHSPALLEQFWNWTHEGLRGALKLPGLAAVRRLEAAALSAASVCHSLSHYSRSRIQELYPQSCEKRWTLIPHWVDQGWLRTSSPRNARRALGWAEESRVVLTVRQLRPRYGIETAIRGLRPLLARGACRFHVVGDGESRPALERLTRELGIAEGVTFAGRLSDEALRLAYQAADLFVLPSRALECFGVIAQEAMAVGLPLVATCVGAIPEMLGPIMPQLLVPPAAEARLAELVAAVLDKSIDVPQPQAIVDYVTARYSETALVAAYERMFAGVAA
ncbi:MAG: glycosyltransferase family 4 protein [Planctomycetes bacterium]|nr:glycosyltransferase family 4 protein [Planctomycetota bacterium]